MIGISGTSGTLKDRCKSGRVFRKITIPRETAIKANKVPILTRSASLFSGMTPAKMATTMPVTQVLTAGAPVFGCSRDSFSGSRPSRPIA
ncbi:hypothetical protein D3C73_1324040 [compost metagenome]